MYNMYHKLTKTKPTKNPWLVIYSSTSFRPRGPNFSTATGRSWYLWRDRIVVCWTVDRCYLTNLLPLHLDLWPMARAIVCVVEPFVDEWPKWPQMFLPLSPHLSLSLSLTHTLSLTLSDPSVSCTMSSALSVLLSLYTCINCLLPKPINYLARCFSLMMFGSFFFYTNHYETTKIKFKSTTNKMEERVRESERKSVSERYNNNNNNKV